MRSSSKALYTLVFLIVILSLVITATGVFYTTGGTTEITYVLDMGIISPLAFLCLYLLKKRTGISFILLQILLTLSMIIGIMLPVQTIFQASGGIDLPLPVLVMKAGSFVALAIFALYFNVRLMRAMNQS